MYLFDISYHIIYNFIKGVTMRHRTYRFNPYEHFKNSRLTSDDNELLEFCLENIFTAAAGIVYVTFEIEAGNKYTAPSIRVLEKLKKTYPTISYTLINKKK